MSFVRSKGSDHDDATEFPYVAWAYACVSSENQDLMKLKNGQKKKTSAAPYQVQRSKYILIPRQSNLTVPLQLRKIYQWLNWFLHLKYGLAVHGICMLVVKPRKNTRDVIFFHAAEVSLRPLQCVSPFILLVCVRSCRMLAQYFILVCQFTLVQI